MKATMDKAGRIVIPAVLRERLGMVPGPVDLILDGGNIVVQVEAHDDFEVDDDGRLVLPATGTPLTTEMIRELRLADQR
ncbi:AbrB/MazE/SpoVT family DNA-binding domain-containing protein [Microbacterium xylanilyticum]